jgi:hypothetical protein
VPGPLSAGLVTSRVRPWGVGVEVDSIGVAVDLIAFEVGVYVVVVPGTQAGIIRTAMIMREKTFFTVHSPAAL